MFDFLLQSDALSAIFAFALVLIPAVIIHELGHFLAAKAVGITVLEFGIGFPPRALTLFRRGATEYTLNWLPIGGFVRPLGEDFVKPVSAEVMEKDKQELQERLNEEDDAADPLYSERAALRARGVKKLQSVNETRPLGRIFFMSAGAIANLITGFIVFIIIGLSGLPTVIGGSVGVAGVEPDSALSAFSLQPGDLIETIDGAYFASADAFFEQLDAHAGETVTLRVQRAATGETEEIVIPLESPIAAPDNRAYVYVSAVSEDSPALTAGMQAGDVITAFNGEPFAAFEDLPARTQNNLGQKITLTLLRAGKTLDVSVVPRENPPANQGAIGIGIMPAFQRGGLYYVEGAPQQSIVALTPGEAVQYSGERVVFFIQEFIRLPAQLISGALSPEEARFVSPLGMSQIGAVFLQESIQQNQPAIILNYIAIISILLGLTQLLPLPMLDGGRIVFVLVEIVRGRPIAPEREGMVHLIGMALLLSLMVLTLLNDIFNPITNMIP